MDWLEKVTGSAHPSKYPKNVRPGLPRPVSCMSSLFLLRQLDERGVRLRIIQCWIVIDNNIPAALHMHCISNDLRIDRKRAIVARDGNR